MFRYIMQIQILLQLIFQLSTKKYTEYNIAR